MTLAEYQAQLLKTIQDAVDNFNAGIPAIEREAYNKILDLIRDVEVKRGQIVNTASNLKKIGQLKGQLEKAILNEKLTAGLQKFVDAFSVVSQIHKQWFGSLDDRAPEEIMKELQKQAKEAVISKLTKEIDVRLIPQVEEILRINITTGAKYTDLLNRMQEFMISGEANIGSYAKLSNLANTITTTALNEYSAQYSKQMTAGFGFKWRMYVGSNLKTTREFCLRMTKKKYVHEKELPQILEGLIDGVQIPINDKTGLWDGAKEGTDINNIDINRGGWKCGHQFLGVPEVSVPLQVRIDTYNRLGIPHKDGFATA